MTSGDHDLHRRAGLRGAAGALVAGGLVVALLAATGGSDRARTTATAGASGTTGASAAVVAAGTEALAATEVVTDPGTATVTDALAPSTSVAARVATSTSVSAGTLTTLATAPQSAVVVPTTSAGPIAVTASTQAPPPSVAVPAYAVLDASSGQWLALDHADDPRPVGSIMKLLTTYVAMQAGSPDQLVTVPPLELDPEESSIGLRPGEQLSRAVLIRAMLIVSANDAARTIALDLGGTTDAFVGLMNQAAKDLGLTQTVAANPIGLDADGAHSSARDMATLAARLMRDTTFQETVRRRTAKLHGTTYSTTNDLLKTYQGADGIKTGHTTDAAYCLVGSATRNGRRLIVVVLGATSNDARVKAAAALLDWAFRRT